MKTRTIVTMALAATLALVAIAPAAAPRLVNYQGALTDDLGLPLSGTYQLTIRIYRDEGAASPSWTEVHQAVVVEQGLFNLILGSVDPAANPFPTGLFDGTDQPWLGVTVGGDPELTPRMPFTSVPWALRATVADSARTGAGGDSDWALAGNDVYRLDGNVGIGTANPVKRLHVDQQNDLDQGIRLASGSAYTTVYADFKVTRGGGGLVINSNAGGGSWADISLQTNGTTKMFINHAGSVGIGTTAPESRLHVEGDARVDVLHITGADVAEHFPVASALEPGTVVAIDRDHPGRLCMSRAAYDRTVAGVVSGAGDLPTGALLGNLPDQGTASPVALSGRVWVKCDATAHPIAAGDLLTSADVAGHAMKAADHARAQGAIIGKAMTPLAGGRGLVLVLVSLQ